jgi:hypothetical protein
MAGAQVTKSATRPMIVSLDMPIVGKVATTRVYEVSNDCRTLRPSQQHFYQLERHLLSIDYGQVLAVLRFWIVDIVSSSGQHLKGLAA